MNDDIDDYQADIFGFCCCGNPDDNLRYIRDGLRCIQLLNSWNSDNPDLEQFRKNYKQKLYQPRALHMPTDYDDWHEMCLTHFGNLEAMYFFFYWADKEGLSEHGGSVPGWLTDKGKTTLEELDILL